MSDWIAGLGSPAAGLGATVALLLAGLGLGLLALPLLRRVRHPFDATLVAVVLGLDVLAVLVLLVGQEQLPPRWTLRAGTLAFAAMGALLVAALVHRRPGVRARLRSPWAWALVACAAAGPLGGALCLPVGWDELTYHVELPARWLASGRVDVFDDLAYSAFPSGLELLHVPAIALGGLTAPRALTFLAWLLSGLALYRLARPALDRRAAAALAFAFSWMPVALMVVAETYVESFVVLHLQALLLALRSRRPLDANAAGAVGALSGFAAAVKLTGAILGPLALLAAAPRGWLGRWKPLLLVAAVVATPFYLGAWASTDNPTYPFFARVFTPRAATAVEVSRYHHDLSAHRYGMKGLAGAALSPLLLTTRGHLYSGNLGWQWPPLLALAVLGAWRSRPARRLLLAAGIGWVAWLLTAQQARLLLPAVALVALAGARGLATLRPRARWLVAAALVAASLASVPRARWMHFWSTWQAGAGIGAAPRPVDYVHTGTDQELLPAMDAIHRLTPPDARVLLLFDPRGLYVPRAHEIGTPFSQGRWLTPPEDWDAARLLAALRERGITHVLVGFPRRDPDVLPEWRARSQRALDLVEELRASGELRLEWEQGRHALHALAAVELMKARGSRRLLEREGWLKVGTEAVSGDFRAAR